MFVFRGGIASDISCFSFGGKEVAKITKNRAATQRHPFEKSYLACFFLFGAWGGVTEIPFGSGDTDRYWETLTIMIFVATADLNKKYLVPEAINSQRISQHYPKIPFLYHRRSGLFA